MVIFVHYKPRIAVADEDDLVWVKEKENFHLLANEFNGNNHFKTLGCREIKSVFRDVK